VPAREAHGINAAVDDGLGRRCQPIGNYPKPHKGELSAAVTGRKDGHFESLTAAVAGSNVNGLVELQDAERKPALERRAEWIIGNHAKARRLRRVARQQRKDAADELVLRT
jgi:hypothetical protein